MSGGLCIGSLCTGYGGLDMAAVNVFGGALAWCADNDRHAAVLLAARYEDVPNLGDITAIDWTGVAPVDIICAGFPCQDISYAGRGVGIKRGSRSGIWINIMAGVRRLEPKIVIVENVAALRRRGLGRVLGDLAAHGYDTVWTSLRASDVGAPHRRERVFVLAFRPAAGARLTAAHAGGERRSWRAAGSGTPGWGPSGGPERSGADDVSRWSVAVDALGGSRHLAESAQPARHADAGGGPDGGIESGAPGEIKWGRYLPAIRRWEAVTGRAAPRPTERGTRGQTRLAADFSEWLMGLPPGFVTAHELPYTAEHRLIGNGVVPQQAAAALRQLVDLAVQEPTAATAA